MKKIKWTAGRDPGNTLRLLPFGPGRVGEIAARADLPRSYIGDGRAMNKFLVEWRGVSLYLIGFGKPF